MKMIPKNSTLFKPKYDFKNMVSYLVLEIIFWFKQDAAFRNRFHFVFNHVTIHILRLHTFKQNLR